MKNDSLSASSKIKELFDLHRSGVLSDEDYHNQLKSWIICHLNLDHLKSHKTEKESLKLFKKYIHTSSGKLEKDEYDLSGSDIIGIEDEQPIKEKVEKVLWTLLN
jgi:hypothetical protein